MHKIYVTQITAMAGRKKGSKYRERVQVHATLTFQHSEQDLGKKDPGNENKDKEKDWPKMAPKALASERASFAEHAIKILDHMMKEKSVGEVLKLGPREEMLGLTPLSMAAAIGHVEGTRKLLEAGAAVDDKSSDGSTALLNAAHWRHLPVLDLLLQHGANVAAVNNEGNNALMVALRHGDVRAVNSLWPHRKQLDINEANNDGYCAIHLAAERKWESCVQFLIQNGADVNKQNNAGQTALHIAAVKGDHPTSERLLAAGASLLVEDQYGNNPFCLAVRGFHDFLAGYFLSQLRPEDKLYFCKRNVRRVQCSQSGDSYMAWNAISFLTSDLSFRDALYQSDVITAAVQALNRRGLAAEVAVQSCLVCCDLMYNPFPIPDDRFVKQFLAARGPEAVLNRLDNRSQEHGHILECKEVNHLQNQVQGQLQTRQQQLDFNTAFILLPIMAMTETQAGREWFAETTSQQRLAAHLRRLTSYRELLQPVSLVQQEVCTREVKLDRVAIVERFINFFKSLETKDHEEKVRELLELEEREKSRKEKKREKKRQQRLKQKLKTRYVGDTHEELCSKDRPCGTDINKIKSQPLDSLDDIPLTVGPNGVRDVSSPTAVTLSPGIIQEPPGSEDEWVMVGGRRCYPAKVKSVLSLNAAENLRENGVSRCAEEITRPFAMQFDPTSNEFLDSPRLPKSHQASVLLNDYGSVDSGGIQRHSSVSDASSKCSKGAMRWADIARNGTVLSEPSEAALLSASNSFPSSTAPFIEEKCKNRSAHQVKEEYHEHFPSLGQQGSVDDVTERRTCTNDCKSGAYNILGAAHQFLEELCNSSSVGEQVPKAATCSGQTTASQGSPSLRISPSALYEALTGWMWQAAVAQGLVNPDTDPPQSFQSVDFLTPLANRFSKLKATDSKHYGVNEDQSRTARSLSKSPSLTNFGHGDVRQPESTVKNETMASSFQSQASATIKDWFDITNTDVKNFSSAENISLISEKPYRHQSSGLRNCTINSVNFHLPTNAQYEVNDGTSNQQDTKTEDDSTATGFYAEDPFLWAGSTFNDWLPSYSSSLTSEGAPSARVSGKPVLDSNDLYGLPVTSKFDSPRILEFPVYKHSEQAGTKKANNPMDWFSSNGLPKHNYTNESEEKMKEGKLRDAGTSCVRHFPATESAFTRDGFSQSNGYPWFCQDSTKNKMKAVTACGPRSSYSETTQSSPTEQKSELIPEDVFSLTPDTSRSSCTNNYDSFHQLTSSNSASSSFTGLHECLAPGFLRAAAGDIQTRSFGGADEDRQEPEEPATIFRPLLGNMGLLPTPTRTAEDGFQGNLDRQYPDLSTVPERDHNIVFPTQLPKALRVVGQGRPRRSVDTDMNVASNSHMLPVGGWSSLQTSQYGAASSTEPGDLSEQAERPESPDVLFPESLRDDDLGERSKTVDVFPSIHDMNERDLFQDVFSNSYFLEQIAIDQIRRRLRAMGGGEEVLRNKYILFHDLDYYASLYGVRLRDILGPLVEAKPPRTDKAAPKKSTDQTVPGWKALVKELGRKMNSKEDLAEAADLDLPSDSEDQAMSDWPWNCKLTPPKIVSGGDSEGEEGWWQEGGGSRRWRTWLRQILDMPWTMRRQYGKIVMPARSMEFNIGRTGRHPLILGFLTDGTEVGVLALDRTRHALDTRLMATVAADSEPDVHFVLRYKAVWECAGRVYLAMELCDYTLDEYVGIVRLDHRQDPLSANRLAWQLLKGLKYLHSNFAVPHGNLMPGWIFVDCDGRLRLAGYGLRDVNPSARSSSRDNSEKSSIEGDARYWTATGQGPNSPAEPSFQADIQVAGMLLHYILTGGRHLYGDSGPEVEASLSRNIVRQHRVSHEADHLVSIMTVSDPMARPSIDACLKHPFFWSGEKRFRLVLIVGSDILTEMKTGVPLTGAGSASMVDILNIISISTVSDNWLSEVDPVLAKEMRAFRQYKNNLPELILFVYNCCLHFDKMSGVAKEVLDDPCKYFQTRFSGLFMAVYRAMKASDRTDRTCYKPFF